MEKTVPVGPPVVEAEGLRKVYGHVVAVDSLDLRIGSGEVFGFLGPNGAGKTTAMKMLLGLAFPTAGQARLLGKPVEDPHVKERIGFLPERFQFPPWLTASEFLYFHGSLYGMSQSRLRERVPQVLHRVGLSARADDKLKAFSKGMLQRIGLAQAILNHPLVVFLDEPTSGLDPLGRREVRSLIEELRDEGATVFLNSHILSDIEMVCDHVAILSKGLVVRSGPLADLLATKLELEMEVDGVTPALMERLSSMVNSASLDGSSLVLELKEEAQIPRIVEAIVSGGGHLYRLTPRRLSLEELFVGLVEAAER